ncbi:hypothetical protein B0H14DRAFT_2561649 [Mycena olivaceomarginata]|nr:hypothetical protein B0H14DRAFT_2561649 [Mycena olivaceomarginata]
MCQCGALAAAHCSHLVFGRAQTMLHPQVYEVTNSRSMYGRKGNVPAQRRPCAQPQESACRTSEHNPGEDHETTVSVAGSWVRARMVDGPSSIQLYQYQLDFQKSNEGQGKQENGQAP